MLIYFKLKEGLKDFLGFDRLIKELREKYRRL
jgi:hypothetical protein